MELKKQTLVYPIRENGKGAEVLLGRKVRKIGATNHAWNGWGGGVHAKEHIKDAAIRELCQESGLKAKPEDLEFAGIIDFKNPSFEARVFTFLLRKWRGEVHPKQDEMVDPTWFPISKLPPWDEFMGADKYFLSDILRGRKISAWFEYADKQQTLAKPPVITDYKGDLPM